MRITVLAVGSRGDVQPMVVLAAELRERGHDVLVAAPDDLVPMASALGLDAVPLGFDVRAFLQSGEGQAWLASGDTRSYLRGLLRQKVELSSVLQPAMVRAAAGADLLLAANLVLDEASCIAEAAGIPVIGMHFVPRRSNPRYPAVTVTARRLPRPLPRLTHLIADRVERRATAGYVNDLRLALGLPPTTLPVSRRLADRGAWELQVYSSVLVPGLEGWPERRPITGFIRATPEQHALWGDAGADDSLDAWLDAGDPPVFFGFGSMPVGEPGPVLALLDQVCRDLRVRGLVGAGWSDFADRAPSTRDRLRVVGALDHRAVLPRCVAAVHHGGAGTTAESLIAGLPTVIAAVFSDQPFWGRRVTELGVGSTFAFVDLSADRLVAALRPLLREEAGRRARTVGAALAREDGVRAAADAVERSVSAGVR
ncbi:glycosyltransferase [Rathayibacter sp. VKM Ac-2762]|uniref:glycosyltransferase n=1 Tax=Rathayibacter sp. VKM Ac-2762 TaxID=2609254 RepID=UPI00132EC737|nr:glycosyltransferase [Rathayibacter sp. VKM Ac-2762]QHF21668.1 glycosyltransferase [Rathayibacter sp. VKM Ac-2762]